jgi:hypothetical protein
MFKADIAIRKSFQLNHIITVVEFTCPNTTCSTYHNSVAQAPREDALCFAARGYMWYNPPWRRESQNKGRHPDLMQTRMIGPRDRSVCVFDERR